MLRYLTVVCRKQRDEDAMKVLFVISDIFLGEPLGILQLSAILKEAGHRTRLLALQRRSLRQMLKEYDPDIIAYSAMSPEAEIFKSADKIVREWVSSTQKRVCRIMGGPHPTYFPEVVNEMNLDAICIGEGDRAIVEIVRRLEFGSDLAGIPNMLRKNESLDDMQKDLVQNLDELPFADKTIYFDAMPLYRSLSMRAIMASRGCPYNCTYCFNHAYRKIFHGCGPMVRRRSVGNVIEELKDTIKKYPPVRFIKFNDDTFAHKVDDWLLEFAKRYKREIGLPFYCLMRSNAMNEDMARTLSDAGCRSISMSVESGNEWIRNEILKRGLTDKMVIDSFRYAHKYGIKTYGNTLLAIPGTTLEDDYNSFFFTKKLKMTVPTFCVFRPYPRLELSERGVSLGVLDQAAIGNHQVGEASPLKCYTPEEKKQQLALSYLGTLLSDLPNLFNFLIRRLCRWQLTGLYRFVGNAYMITKAGLHVFPGIYPRSPLGLFRLMKDSMQFFKPNKNIKIT